MRSSALLLAAALLSFIAGCDNPGPGKVAARSTTDSSALRSRPYTPPPPARTVSKPGPRGPAPAGPWITHSVSFNASTALLLTDGRVMCQDEDAVGWWLLTPDSTGSYSNGTWSAAASMSKGRLYYASAVLKDGRVVVFGGEYIAGSPTDDDTGEVYDPVANTWSPLGPPSTWSMIGDAPCSLLADGRLLVGALSNTSTEIWDPTNSTWTNAGTKLGNSGEETWVLLPDGSVLTIDCDLISRSGKSELWVPGKGWIDAGTLPIAIVDPTLNEIGPALLLNNGQVIFFGGTGHTALYTPSSTAGQVGTWAQGPEIPADSTGTQSASRDAPAVLLPNGHVLVTASSPTNGGWGGPTSFFDLDPTTTPMTMTSVAAPTNNAGPPYEGRMLLLPNGETLYAQGASSPLTVSFYNAVAPSTAHAPTITNAPGWAPPGNTFQLTGTLLNGVSQAVSYGDDATSATNYPLVRLTNSTSHVVYYARTHDHSTMGVATGSTPETTMVTIPASLPNGSYRMEVVANAIPSTPVTIQISNVAPPTVALSSPSAGSVSGVVSAAATAAPAAGTTLTSLALTIDGSQVASGGSPQSYSWDTTALANGSSHAIVATATDADLGAASATAVVTVKNKPAVTLTPVTDGSTVNGVVAITATGTAPNGTTLSSLAVSLDGVPQVTGANSPQTFSWNTIPLANGAAHTLVATATDADGSTNSTTVQVTVRNVPAVAIIIPVNAAAVRDVVVVTATGAPVNGTALSSLAISVDGAPLTTGSGSPQTGNWDTRGLANGSSHTIVATATDADGANASATITVTIKNNPAVAITSPASASGVKGKVPVQVSATAANGTALQSLTVSVDGTQLLSAGSSPQTVNWDTGPLANGSAHVIVATATDADGATATASSSVTVANVPVVAVTSPNDGDTVKGFVTVSASATAPDGASLPTLSIAIDGAPVRSGSSSPQTFSWDTTHIAKRPHAIIATATASDGTSATSATVTVHVDNGGGCGCAAGRGDSSALWTFSLGLLGLGMARKRRR